MTAPTLTGPPLLGPDGEPLERWIVGVERVDPPERRVIRRLIDDDVERDWTNLIGADDDGRFALGADVTYALDMTPAEAEELDAESNVRYVEPESYSDPHIGSALKIPTISTLSSMRAAFDERRWHGRDQIILIIDQGTTKAVRDYMGFVLVGRAIFGIDPAPNEIFPTFVHGCLVAPNAVPYGGLLLDAVNVDSNGRIPTSGSVAAIRWGADLGARFANMSFGAVGIESGAWEDAFTYARNAGMQCVASMGNDNLNAMSAPASYSKTYTNVHSSIALDEDTDTRAPFSNFDAAASGCAPGVQGTSLTPDAVPTFWDGTSESGPHMVRMGAQGATGGTFTPAQIMAALRANTRDTGQAALYQGAGAWDLRKGLTALGAIPAPAAGVATPTVADVRSGTASTSSWTGTAPNAVDDLRLAFLVGSAGSRGWYPPDGWMLLDEATYGSSWAAVMAFVYDAAHPNAQINTRNFATWFSVLQLVTLRAPGGLDPGRIVPTIKFGTSAVAEAPAVDPVQTNDLLLRMHAVRAAAGPAATLTPRDTAATLRQTTKPTATGTGYAAVLTSRALSAADRVPSALADLNESTSLWTGISLTVPSAPVP